MHLLIFMLLAKTISTQENTIDPSILTNIWGAPEPNPATAPLNNTLEVTPILANSKGERCYCVPYYLCDKSNIVIDEDNVAVTGWGQLNERFGADSDRVCPRKVEVCCTAPKDPKVVGKVTPDSSTAKGCGYRNRGGLGVTEAKNNGTQAQLGEFPWVVAIFEVKTGRHIGGGAIIRANVVITAIHLVYKYLPGNLKVRAGDWDLESENEIFDFQERIVQEISFRTDFNFRDLSSGIALLRLQKPFVLSNHVNVICIHDNPLPTNCVANGWGKNEFGRKGHYSKILKRADVDVVQDEQCQTLLRRTRLGNKFSLHFSFTCAGGEEGVDTCEGDGGAPLACPIDKERYALAGLAAWGIGCGQMNVPGVYVSITKEIFILNNKMTEWGYGSINISEP